MGVGAGEFCMAACKPIAQACLLERSPVLKVGRTRDVSKSFRRLSGSVRIPRHQQWGEVVVQRNKRFCVESFLHDESLALLVEQPAKDVLEGDGSAVEVDSSEVIDGRADPLLDVQVLSPEEQRALAATPAHPQGLQAMYVTYVAACFVERVWRFAWPVLLAALHDSLLPVAIVSFVSQHTWRFALPAVVALLHHSLLPVAVVSFASELMIFVGGPYVGVLMDSLPRVMAFNALSVAQTIAMLISAAMTIYAIKNGVAASATASALVLQPWFLALVLAGGVEKLTGLATGVAFERDWVVLLAGANRPIALANANAILRRVDLVCEIAGPLFFGMLLSVFHPIKCVYVAVVAMIISLPLLVFLVIHTDRMSSGALHRPKHVHSPSATSGSSPSSGGSPGRGLDIFLVGWKKYLAQPVLPASLAYVLLYFNAVLAPGGLMTSFLTQRGLNPSLVGAFRGACALMGFAATFLSANLISRLGVLKAGAAALFFQALLLVMAVGVYWLNPFGKQGSLILFLFLIVTSRLGQWAYDMVDAQIFQTAISVSDANVIGTTEISLASLAELTMLGVAIVANDVAHFGGLAALSTVAVVGAAWLYWSWLSNPTVEQRRLFPHDPLFDTSETALQFGLQAIIPVPKQL